jgi:hypothetical protein
MVVLAVLICGPVLAASAGDDIIIGGDFRLIVDPVPNAPLERTAHGTATFALAFASEVGGINFQAAIPFANAHGATQTPTLSYVASAPDGSRLHMNIGSKVYITPLYDWQLKPIVVYADSDYTAVVSLFGRGPDRQHYFYIQYHPAFQDTLLGLRLLQTDMFLMDPLQLRGMPETQGHPILGPGERTPDETISLHAAQEITRLLEGNPAGSWILNDVDVNPTLDTNLGELFKIAGTPYYFFWHLQPNRINVIAKLLSWKAEHPQASVAEGQDKLREIVAKSHLVPSTQHTDLLRYKYDLYLDANPAVFQSSLYTMQYAALFRGIKVADPTGWKRFADVIKAMPMSAVLRTPTRLGR